MASRSQTGAFSWCLFGFVLTTGALSAGTSPHRQLVRKEASWDTNSTNSSCWRPPLDCVETFVYKGDPYKGCIDVDSHEHWCSLDADYDLNGRWKYCSQVVCAKKAMCWMPAKECLSAFEYGGVVHKGCTMADSDRHWCARDERSSSWTYCKYEECGANMCWYPTNGCVEDFTYKNASYTNCTKVDSDHHWCSHTANYESDGLWSYCAQAECPKMKCWTPVQGCVDKFSYQSINYTGCTNVDSDSLWCARDQDASSWSYCVEEDCDKQTDTPLPCYEPDPICVPIFNLHGQRIKGCVTDGSQSWCSLDTNFTTRSEWRTCREVQCDKCWLRSPLCVSSFLFTGLVYHGCVNVASDFPWCAKDPIVSKFGGRWAYCMPCRDRTTDEANVCYAPAQDCVPQFFYEGRLYSGCTSSASNAYWCSRERFLEDGSGRSNCERKPCDKCWLRDPDCKDEWKYNGITFKGCTNSGSVDGEWWCSLDAEFNDVGGRWKHCDPCKAVTEASVEGETCWLPTKGCVQPFTVDGVPATGCLRGHEANSRAWCSKTEHFNSLSQRQEGLDYDWCTPAACTDVCWQPHATCKESFLHKGRHVEGCVKDADSFPWCSTEDEFDEEVSHHWHYCKAVHCDQLCHQVAKTCVQPFRYQGEEYVGCTKKDYDMHWCSEVPVLPMGSSAWLPCAEVSCKEVCYLPHADCLDSFEYRGNIMTGCAPWASQHHAHWCSLTAHINDSSSDWKYCLQTDCRDVCWQRPASCVRRFVHLDRAWHGCIEDQAVLQGEAPWCSEIELFDNDSEKRKTCKQISCHQAECTGPECEQFLILKSPDAKCLNADGDAAKQASWGITFEHNCQYPDYGNMMVRMNEVEPGYYTIEHIRGKCVHPESRAFGVKDRLVVRDACSRASIFLFRKIDRGAGYFSLVHYTERCVGVERNSLGTKEVLVVSKDCPWDENNNDSFSLVLREFPRPCLWDEWSDWSACSVTCGNGGKKMRRRVILRRAERGGARCYGAKLDHAACGKACPVDCVLGPWDYWGPCTKPCGGGYRTRIKQTRVQPSFGGRACNSPKERLACNSMPCPKMCKWDDWTQWSDCSQSCGGGMRQRLAVVLEHPDNADCPVGRRVQDCGNVDCPRHCSIGGWSDWGLCSASCGGGHSTRSRVREIWPENGGLDCSIFPEQNRICATIPCPVDCSWKPWEDWNACTMSCGGGSHYRKRGNITEQHGGVPCQGYAYEDRVCGEDLCPIDCVWASWTEWTRCQVSCGGGVIYRSRHQHPPAGYGGVECLGPKHASMPCSVQDCPVDCVWEGWSSWGTCLRSCGGSQRDRKRSIAVPHKFGGRECPGLESMVETCNLDPCPMDCEWGEWTNFTECSELCGGGRKVRHRVERFASFFGGRICEGENYEEAKCGADPCPVHCEWGDWSTWASCSQTCLTDVDDVPQKWRHRTIAKMRQNGGMNCVGPSKELFPCGIYTYCPIHCRWGTWSAWSACGATCGDSGRYRVRGIEKYAQFGGRVCAGERFEESPCVSTMKCPIDCRWFPWGAWHKCTTSCGGGKRMRVRFKAVESNNGGAACKGVAALVKPCSQWACPVDCQWGQWGNWSECPRSCGRGTQSRSRQVAVVQQEGGKICKGPHVATKWCATRPCLDGWASRSTVAEFNNSRKAMCPAGWKFNDGNLEGCGLVGECVNTAKSIEDCAHQCDRTLNCYSFAWYADSRCFLHGETGPTLDIGEAFEKSQLTFCSKVMCPGGWKHQDGYYDNCGIHRAGCNLRTSSVEKCSKVCERTRGCVAFAWHKGRHGVCLLTGTTELQHIDGVRRHNVIRCVKEMCVAGWTFIDGLGEGGLCGNVGKCGNKADALELCAHQCNNTQCCRSFAYVPSDRLCALYNESLPSNLTNWPRSAYYKLGSTFCKRDVIPDDGCGVVEKVPVGYFSRWKNLAEKTCKGTAGILTENKNITRKKCQQLCAADKRCMFYSIWPTSTGAIDRTNTAGMVINMSDTVEKCITRRRCNATVHDEGKRVIVYKRVEYVKTAVKETCDSESSRTNITTAEQCHDAAVWLGLVWGASYDSQEDHQFCMFAEDERKTVYFNAANDSAAANPPSNRTSSICIQAGNAKKKRIKKTVVNKTGINASAESIDGKNVDEENVDEEDVDDETWFSRTTIIIIIVLLVVLGGISIGLGFHRNASAKNEEAQKERSEENVPQEGPE